MGNYIFGKISDWPKRFKIVGDVRGKGLMVGTEFVRDQRTKEKAQDLRDKVVDAAFHKGLLTLGSGENSIRMSPALIIDEEQADCAIQIMEDSIRQVEKTL
jgi:4-aminobutyrate aminotransferase